MQVFFTADEHYGHSDIMKICGRPFMNVDKMDNTLIKRHNELVNNEDTVFHIGDFCLKSSTGFSFSEFFFSEGL